ncbi:hypothetical protein RFI_25963 [Reticulomyxa filosa]|uniref:Uncharacterized protein n=1 Tax=Reticulomyxa filosa TaxID=46433 RepID=X6MBP3_RETFI|nr:hypothetical protein RFI_25963 [Reticulomyxa filosa]|eukprot:ETO11413.1 hypothetical protein RFI_25963 [Reticulomyxa filosa]
MVFSLFVLNGVSSCMYHLTLQLGWKATFLKTKKKKEEDTKRTKNQHINIADEFTMILAVDLGLYQFFLQTLHELLLNDDIYQYLHPLFSAAMDNIAKLSLVIFFCGHDSARKIDTRMFLKQKVFPALVNWIGFFIMTGW